MMTKHIKLWHTFFLTGIVLLVFFSISFITNTTITFADEEYEKYDTIPVLADGSEGELVHPVKITSGSGTKERTMYLVKLPENTTTVKFYDSSEDQNQYYNSPKQQGCSHFNTTFSKTDYYNDGWWIINVSDLSFKTKTVWYNNLKAIEEYYVKEAEYYELIPEAGNTKNTKAHLFIQIGDSDHPLDVYATGDGVRGDYFNEDSRIELALQLTNNRDGIINNSNQDIYYTADNTDPTSSNTAIKYTEPFVVTRSCTIQAASKVTDDKWGKVIQVQCVINLLPPSFSPAGGCYFGKQEISLSSYFADADIFYSTDGTEPIPIDDDGNLVENDSIKKYESPIDVDKDQTIKAVAVKKAINDFGDEVYIISAVVTAKYTLSTGIDIQFNGEDQGVWIQEYLLHMDMDELDSHKHATIVTPYGHSKCSVVVSADENATLKLDNKSVDRESDGEYKGKFILDLNVKECAGEDDNGIENVITVTNGDESTEYKIFCVSSRYNDVPDEVKDYYVPASQYTNNGIFGCAPNRTLRGGERQFSGSSLGNYGGYITWYYRNGIKDDKNNPYGVDFVVFGNSVDGTNEFAEPGNIYVSVNGTEWYTLAGALHYDHNAVWNQQVQYNKVDGFAEYSFDGINDTVPAGSFVMPSGQARFLYPDKFYYPLHSGDEESFTTTGTFLIPDGGVNAYGNVRPPFGAFGYADVGKSDNCSNEIANPYGGIFRDQTYTDRLNTNRVGDACDIAWAVDENGIPVHLDEIHYIKVQTASFIDDGAIGEKSTEVNGMRIAKPADSAVGVTAAPSSIKIDGTNMELKSGEIVDANVNGVFDVAVDAPEDTNVYINSLRSHTAFMKEAPHDIVRVIVQEGEKEPLIYYYNIKQEADSNTVYEITLDPGKGLLQDKENLTCYVDSDTIEHFGGKMPLPDAQAAKEVQKFAYWYADLGEEGEKRYDAVTAENAEELAGKTLKAFYAKAEDVDAVRKVEALIEALPEADKVTLDDNESILEARQAYDALSDDQKALLIPDHKTKLEADEAAVIKLVEDMIDTLPEAAAVKTTDEEAVIAVGAAFDSLADTQKALVDQAKAEKLAAVRLALFDAFAAAIPDEVTEEQEDALAAAQAVYDSLPNDLKVQAAANYIKLVEAKLSVAMEKLEKANQQIADKQSEIDKLTNETIPALTQQLNDKIAELKTAKEEEIPALQAEIAELEQKLEKAGSDLADANAEIEELRKELVDNSIKDLIESAEKTIAAIQKDLKEAGDSISTKAIKALVETADQILDAAKTKAEEASAALAENAKEIASLRDQVAKASADLAKAGEELAKAVASGKASEAEITGLKDRLAEAEAAKAEAEKAAQEALAGKQTSDEALEAAQKALKETQDELEKTAAELAALQAEIAASKFKVKGLTVTSKSSKFTVTWTKFDGADGYKVQYRKKGAKKYKNLKELTKNKVVSKKLKKGKAYQFRVRTYKMVGEKKVYGKWAKSKAVKCK